MTQPDATREKSVLDIMLRAAVRILLIFIALLVGFYIYSASTLSSRLQDKISRTVAGVNYMIEHDQDPAAIVDLLQQVRPLAAEGKIAQAEQALDTALAELGPLARLETSKIPLPLLPVYDAPEKTSDLFGAPRKVEIIGYYGDAMEPFLSADGRWLLFNDRSAFGNDTNIFYAERTENDAPLFEYRGALRGANSLFLDAAPSLDDSGRFYFVSTRAYHSNLGSLYEGRFTGEGVAGIGPLSGGLRPDKFGRIVMDAAVSPDGTSLYYTDAQFLFGHEILKNADIGLAVFEDGGFFAAPGSDEIMKNINTNALEYAPSITADGLELYFTRSSRRTQNDRTGPDEVRILVARRASIDEPFGEPAVLNALGDFAAAPAITPDGQTLYFHRRDGGGFALYRAERKR